MEIERGYDMLAGQNQGIKQVILRDLIIRCVIKNIITMMGAATLRLEENL